MMGEKKRSGLETPPDEKPPEEKPQGGLENDQE